jgi:hypothetical protein
MAQPVEHLSSWHPLAAAQHEAEPNPVVTPYKKSDARVLYDEGGLLIEHRYVEMKNGLVYPVLSSHVSGHVPEGLRGLAHVEGVGWTTRPEGLYVERQKLLGSLAVESTTIGIPQNIGTFISYDDYANDFESIVINEALERDRDPRIATKSGLSQSAMLLFGLIVIGKRDHGVNTVSAHAAVPCLPDGITAEHWRHIPGHLIETASKLPYELNAFKRITQMDQEKRKMLMPTVDLSKRAPITQLQMLRSLLSGKSGEYALQLPDDVPVVVELKDKDMLSRARRWRKKYLKDKQNAKIVRDRDGSHADVVSEISQSNWSDFEIANATLLREHPELRSDPTTAAGKVLELLKIHYPQYTNEDAA